MADYFDTLETRDPERRERELLAQLPRQIAHAKAMRAGVRAHPRRRRRRVDHDPRGARAGSGDAQVGAARPAEIGPSVRRPRGNALGRRACASSRRPARSTSRKAAGPTTGGWRGPCSRPAFAAAISCTTVFRTTSRRRARCSRPERTRSAAPCFPAGIGQTEQQVQAMADLRPAGYVGTPSFLKIILEKADEMGIALPSLTKALVSAEAFPKSFCDALLARGIAGYQAYASADLGAIAYETEAREGLVIDEGVLVEIVRPGTGDPVAPGEVGEVVVTSLFNTDYPMIRFGTGDLSAILPGTSPCGRTNLRIKGWMGRADQTTKVKGMFVHPAQVAAIVGPPPGNREGAARRRQCRRRGPHDAQRRGARQPVVDRRRDRRVDPRRHEAARRSRVPRAGRVAQRRQGDRRRAQVRLTACALPTGVRSCIRASHASGSYSTPTRLAAAGDIYLFFSMTTWVAFGEGTCSAHW